MVQRRPEPRASVGAGVQRRDPLSPTQLRSGHDERSSNGQRRSNAVAMGGGKNKHHRQKKKPRRFPAGAFYQVVGPNLPVALSAEEQGNGVLILQLVGCKRLTRRTGRSNGANDTRILLVDTGPGNLSRERQVLDRGPAGDETHRADGEVRVTTRHTGNAAEHATSTTGAADRGLGQGTELGLGVSTVDRGVPVGVPVVGVRTAEAPGL